MNKPKKHHFVPECYLKQYGSDAKLYCSNIKTLIKYIKKNNPLKEPSQICYDIDLYTINEPLEYNLNDYDELYVESKVLHSSENKYRSIINKIFDSKELTYDDSIFLSDFIIQLKLRNPFYLQSVKNNFPNTADKMKINFFNDMKNSDRFKNIPLALLKYEIEKGISNLKSKNNIFRSLQLKSIIDKSNPNSLSIEKFREAILNYQFTLLDSSESERSFITSDNPGYAITNENKLENTKFKNGFTYYLPLTPKYCLQFSDKLYDHFHTNKGNIKFFKTQSMNNNEIDRINFYSSRLINKLR